MDPGYLIIDVDPEHPELVRVHAATDAPDLSRSTRCFVARFEDIEAAMMHFHQALRRQLADLDRRLYRTDVGHAIAVADAIDLPHRRIFIDPAYADDPALPVAIARRRQRHRRWQQVFTGVGILAVIWLVILTLLGF